MAHQAGLNEMLSCVELGPAFAQVCDMPVGTQVMAQQGEDARVTAGPARWLAAIVTPVAG